MLEIIVLFLCFCLLVGSWSYVKPSPKERHQSDLRMRAIKAGLKIKQQNIADTSVTGRVNELKKTVMTYQLLFPVESIGKFNACVQRTSGENDLTLPQGWVWEKPSNDPVLIDFLNQQLPLLPSHFDLLRFESHFVSLAWSEKGDQLVDLHARLVQCSQLALQSTP